MLLRLLRIEGLDGWKASLPIGRLMFASCMLDAWRSKACKPLRGSKDLEVLGVIRTLQVQMSELGSERARIQGDFRLIHSQNADALCDADDLIPQLPTKMPNFIGGGNSSTASRAPQKAFTARTSKDDHLLENPDAMQRKLLFHTASQVLKLCLCPLCPSPPSVKHVLTSMHKARARFLQ